MSIVFFPIYFQEAFVRFAWGAGDPTTLLVTKRLFLLLPVLAFIASCWISIAGLLSVLFRPNRQRFVATLFLTWGELGKSVFAFWGGIFNFVYVTSFALIGFVKLVLFGLWAVVKDVLFLPFRLFVNFSRRIIASQIPWIAVTLTLFWCFIETLIFTYITTPLVIDVFSNITGQQLAENVIRIPLFLFLFFIVMGSYAVLSTLFTVTKSKNIPSIIGIFVVEVIVIFVEVIFLYREFVDAIVPWLAQYSENFELGLFWTIAISVFVWFGIRSLSWFLFAAYGTPTILRVIQGKGLELQDATVQTKTVKLHSGFSDFIEVLKTNTDWIKAKGNDLLNAFILPPLQVVAATINFIMLLITDKHLFDLPFEDVADFTQAKEALQPHPAPVEDEHPRRRPEPMRTVRESKVLS